MTEIETTLQDLERALSVPKLAPRLADGCARLMDRLRRPVHVGVFGVHADQRDGLIRNLFGAEFLADWPILPTVEITYGDAESTCATLADGTRHSFEGLPDASLVPQSPVFLEISLATERLKRMSVLCPGAGTTQAEQSAALAWAAPRTDIALWCTSRFDSDEEVIWAHAPDRLKNHAYMVAIVGTTELADLRDRADSIFERVIALSDSASSEGCTDALLKRLNADIDAALSEDVDAARLLLHRCGAPKEMNRAQQAVSAPAAADRGSSELSSDDGPSETDVDLLSEPFLFLKRRARNLAESLDWRDEEEDDWAEEVLEHCNETANGLLDRATAWPEDNRSVVELRDLISEAAEMSVLLNVEGGSSQAEDAAILVFQLRTEFESRLTPERLAS